MLSFSLFTGASVEQDLSTRLRDAHLLGACPLRDRGDRRGLRWESSKAKSPPTGPVHCAVTWLICVCFCPCGYTVCGLCAHMTIFADDIQNCFMYMWIYVYIYIYIYACAHVYLYSICASCPVLPSGRMCNGDKLLLLASSGFSADLFQVCVCVSCACVWPVLKFKKKKKIQMQQCQATS